MYDDETEFAFLMSTPYFRINASTMSLPPFELRGLPEADGKSTVIPFSKRTPFVVRVCLIVALNSPIVIFDLVVETSLRKLTANDPCMRRAGLWVRLLKPPVQG